MQKHTSLRTLKIMSTNLNEIVRSLIRLLETITNKTSRDSRIQIQTNKRQSRTLQLFSYICVVDGYLLTVRQRTWFEHVSQSYRPVDHVVGIHKKVIGYENVRHNRSILATTLLQWHTIKTLTKKNSIENLNSCSH